jgi:hypothetical protein
MPLNDFNIYKSTAGIDVDLDATAPLIGISSLLVDYTAPAGTPPPGEAVNVALKTSVGVGPFTRGSLRTLFAVTTASYASPHAFGIFCQASQRDLTGGTGTCYAAVLQTTGTSGTVDSFDLVEFASGIEEPPTALESESGLALPASTTIAIELEWELLDSGYIVLTGRRGSADDFSDLVQKWQKLITTSVLSTSQAEGLCFFLQGGGDFTVRADETIISELP